MKILIRDDKSKKWELVESNAYEAEVELQALLAGSPEIINMEEIRPGSGPLVAVVREFSLPVGRIDLLAFTAHGDIAIIECKLEKNTQAKREVTGQILDYAAHLWGMSYESLDQQIQSMTNHSLADLVREHADNPEWDEEEFRTAIRSTLEQGNFILTIAVNEINEELHRIIRYVNSLGELSFSFAALEMKRFQKSKVEMLVPHVFGPVHTTPKSQSAVKNNWNADMFFEELRTRHGEQDELAARKILAWAEHKVSRLYWGQGSRSGSFVPIYVTERRKHQLFAVWTYGTVEIYFQHFQGKPPFNDEKKRMELLKGLNEIEGVHIPTEMITKRPSIELSVLVNEKSLEKFLSVYDWVLDEIKKFG